MIIQNYRDIKHRSKQALDYTPWDIKKLVLIFGLVSVCASPLLLGLDALLALGTNSASGLGGLAVYSMLDTISYVVSMGFSIFSIFWGPAILYCALMILREQNPWPKGLFQGFRKWLPLVKYMILLVAFLLAVVMVLSPVVAIFAMPFLGDYMAILENAPQDAQAQVDYINSIPMEQLTASLMPIIIIMTVLLLAVAIPLSYRVRLTPLLLLDEAQIGTREAIRCSFRLTIGSCKQLFFMDLSFWWYYLLLVAAGALPYLSQLPIFGTWNATLVTLALSVVSAAATLGVYMLGLMKVKTADAVAYDHLRTQVLFDLPQLPEGSVYGTNL